VRTTPSPNKITLGLRHAISILVVMAMEDVG